MTIVSVLGTRPEIIKMSPLIPAFDGISRHVLVHSGQHYSAEMDAVFFQELELRSPDHHLGVGSIAPAAQVARIAEGVEQIIIDAHPDWVVVHGDTNTTLGGAVAAVKHRSDGVRLAHVEAGARSFNRLQPEEINRVLVDQMADLLFTPTDDDAQNLLREGIDSDRIVVSGNTVVESCQRMATLAGGETAQTGPDYAIATIHRQETVDDQQTLRSVWASLADLAERIPVVVPLHPRARKMLSKAGIRVRAVVWEESDDALELPGLHVVEPVGYRVMVALLKSARFCLTDSGGLQEEAAILRVPTLILRNETEHRRYVDCGLHDIVGHDRDRIASKSARLLNDDELLRRKEIVPPIDTNVVETIVRAVSA